METPSSYIKVSVQEDVDALKDNLREIDLFECKSVSGNTGAEALQNCLDNSLVCYTIFINEKQVAMFGMTSTDKKHFGVIWLLGSDDTRKATNILVKHAKDIIEELLALRPILFNYVSVKNKTSIKWLKAIGFSVDMAPITYGIAGEKFYLFYKKKEVEGV